MAKKKNQTKKHHFKYSETAMPVDVQQQVGTDLAESPRPAMRQRPAMADVSTRDFSYVANDLKRISMMAAGLVCLELVLWGLLSHTGLGDAVYRLVKV